MKSIIKKLTHDLQQDLNVKITHTSTWTLPVHEVEVSFNTVLKTKMDILMKMMLIAFEKATIESVDDLSEILLVEPLFIRDLLSKMTNAGLIQDKGNAYELTGAGKMQLESGIFDHEPKSGKTPLLYSSFHQKFMNEVIDENSDDTNSEYRYFKKSDEIAIENPTLMAALRNKGIESIEGNKQIVVSEVHSVDLKQIEQIPCIEFHVYNEREDLLYARVWNTLLQQWDESLETQVNENERKKWQNDYIEKSDTL
ncbi:hypothetical protein ACXYMX_07265 [Sporosarcina sp. CAU 1771]